MGNAGADYTYTIKTVADLKDIEASRKALEEARKSYLALGQSTEGIDRRIQKLDAAMESTAANSIRAAESLNKAISSIRSAGGKVDSLVAERNAILKQSGLKEPGRIEEAFHAFKETPGVMGGLEAAAGVFGKGTLAAVGGIATALETGREALQEYAKAEDELFARNAALKQRGQLTGEYQEKLDNLAETQAKLTAKSSEEWTRGLTTLIQAGANPGQIERVTTMVKNAAGLPQMFGSVATASEAVGKAIGGNFEPFTRLGFIFTENADLAHKLIELYDQLATRGGGQLEERAKTLHGRFDTLKNSTGEFFKVLGKGVADTGVVQVSVGLLINTFDWWEKKLKGTQTEIKGVSESVGGMNGQLLTAEQRAQNLQTALDKIKRIPDDAAKRREDFGSKLSKENQRKLDAATDAAGLETAKIDTLEKVGALKPEEAERRRRQVASGLETAKQGIAVGELNSQIGNRQQGLDSAKMESRRAEDAARSEEQKLAKFKQLAAEEAKIARHYDDKIAPMEAALAANLQVNGAGMPGSTISRPDPKTEAEIAEQKRQKEKALKEFRQKNPYNLEDQEERARTTRATADATTEADMANAKKIAEEKRELEQQLAQAVLKNRIQNQTRSLGDFGAVYSATQKDQSGNAVNAIGGNLNQAAAVVARNTDTVEEILRISQQHARVLIAEQRRGINHEAELAKLRELTYTLQAQIRNNPNRL